MMADGSDLVLTREPLGGKPQGIDAGPVVAEGQLQAI
jgi:anti-sigma-K factor RskA